MGVVGSMVWAAGWGREGRAQQRGRRPPWWPTAAVMSVPPGPYSRPQLGSFPACFFLIPAPAPFGVGTSFAVPPRSQRLARPCPAVTASNPPPSTPGGCSLEKQGREVKGYTSGENGRRKANQAQGWMQEREAHRRRRRLETAQRRSSHGARPCACYYWPARPRGEPPPVATRRVPRIGLSARGASWQGSGPPSPTGMLDSYGPTCTVTAYVPTRRPAQ